MKNFLLVLTVIFSGWLSAKSINRTLDGDSVTSIDINNLRGSVVVEGWDKSQVQVVGNIDNTADEFVFKTSGDEILVHVIYPGGQRSFGNSGSKLKIMIPHNLNLEFQGVSSSFSATNIDGNLEVASVSGSLIVDDIRGELALNSVSGKIDLKNIVGPLSVTTVSGDLVANILSKDIYINAISADVNVTGDEVLEANLSNVSGDTVFSAEVLSQGDVVITNVSGESEFKSIGQLNAKVIMQTGPGGDIRNRLTSKKPEVSFIRDESLDFVIGTGTSRVRLTTVSGTVSIR